MSVPHNYSRRGLLGLAALSVLSSAACQSSGDSASPGSSSKPSSAGGTKSFRFTDARGKRVELPTLPSTVVAQSSVAAALWDVGYQVSGIYGELQQRNGELDYQAGSVDLSQMTVLGRTYGQFNIEKYAALDPDLIIDMTYDMKSLWYAAEVESKISKLAPSIGMQLVGLSVVEQIENHTELGVALGADTEAAGVPQAKADFEAAGARVTAAAKAQPGLTVLALSFGQGQVHLANPKAHPDLGHLAELGVTFPEIEPEQEGSPFQVVSLENLSSYRSDIVLVDARNYWADEYSKAKEQPIWTSLPAVEAGQVYSWYPLAPFSYKTYAELLDQYADHLDGAAAT